MPHRRTIMTPMLWFGLAAELRALRERVVALEAYTDVAGLEEQRRKMVNAIRSVRRLVNDVYEQQDTPAAPQDPAQLQLVPELTIDELADARRRYG